jgi:hypothetical protein
MIDVAVSLLKGEQANIQYKSPHFATYSRLLLLLASSSDAADANSMCNVCQTQKQDCQNSLHAVLL